MLNSDYLPKDFGWNNQEQLSLMNNFAVQGLIEVIRKIMHLGKRRGIRHKVEIILALLVCAVLCEARSYLGIWEWANELPKQALERFGCYSGRRPSEAMIRRVIQKLDQTVITMDALLAQKKIAEYIVQEKNADYVVTVKSNQKM